MRKRVYIFIDGSNFYHRMIHLLGHSQLGNYSEFLEKLMNDDQDIVGVIYYIGKINKNTGKTINERKKSMELYKKQLKFLDWLKECGIEYKLGYFQKDGFQEKGVDVKIAVDMIKLAYEDQYDEAFLISGDGDLCDAVKLVKELGKSVYNLIFHKGGSFSYRLRNVCEKYFYIDRQIEQFIKKTKRK